MFGPFMWCLCEWLCNSVDLLCFSRTIHYYAELGQRSVFPTCEVPEHFVGQVTVLKYFSHYMEENLMDVSKPLYSPTPLSCYYVSFVFPPPEALEMVSVMLQLV